MRSNWALTRFETVLLIMAVTLMASGFVWISGSMG